MKRKTVLYPKVIVIGEDFSKVKKHVVPRQSMTLKEIIKRFLKKEALPQLKEAVYNEEYDLDLEKVQHKDVTEKDEMIADMREKVKRKKKQLDDEAEAETRKAVEKKAAERKALLEELRQSDPSSKTDPPKV